MDLTELRSKLRAKTGWSQSGVSNRIRALYQRHLVPKTTALMYLAHKAGLNLTHFGAESADLEAVRELDSLINGSKNADSRNDIGPGRARTPKRNHVFASPEFPTTEIPNYVAATITSGRRRSGEAYGVISVLEQSIRELIRRVMLKHYGTEWWNQVPRKQRSNADRMLQHDESDPWHEPRGNHPLYYLSFSDYSQIITSQKLWHLFEPVFERRSFPEEVLRDANLSRRTVAHMGELSVEDFTHLKTAARKLLKTLKAKEQLIP